MGVTRETQSNFFPRNMPLDEGLESNGTGDTFPVRLRRMTVDQLVDFQRGYSKVINPTFDQIPRATRG
jgi:hypothetical protein